MLQCQYGKQLIRTCHSQNILRAEWKGNDFLYYPMFHFVNTARILFYIHKGKIDTELHGIDIEKPIFIRNHITPFLIHSHYACIHIRIPVCIILHVALQRGLWIILIIANVQ